MIGHRMDSGENEVGELHCALIGVITHVVSHMFTTLVGVSDTYN